MSEEFIPLPAIPVSAGALIYDRAGRLLILKPTSLLAKIAMAIIVAFTDPGDGEPLRHAVRRLAEAA